MERFGSREASDILKFKYGSTLYTSRCLARKKRKVSGRQVSRGAIIRLKERNQSNSEAARLAADGSVCHIHLTVRVCGKCTSNAGPVPLVPSLPFAICLDRSPLTEL